MEVFPDIFRTATALPSQRKERPTPEDVARVDALIAEWAAKHGFTLDDIYPARKEGS